MLRREYSCKSQQCHVAADEVDDPDAHLNVLKHAGEASRYCKCLHDWLFVDSTNMTCHTHVYAIRGLQVTFLIAIVLATR